MLEQLNTVVRRFLPAATVAGSIGHIARIVAQHEQKEANMTKNLRDYVRDTATKEVENGILSDRALERMTERARRTLERTGSLESQAVHGGLSAALDTVRKSK
jgi:hypothetical protein